MFDLSRSQEIVWLHEELFPDSKAYNFTAALHLRGDLDVAALRASLAALLDRHEGLRLELLPDTFPPQQRVNPSCAPRVRTVDLSRSPDREAAFEREWRAQHDQHFDTAEAPMVRWTLLRFGPAHHCLLHTEHHLVHDGASFAWVLRDLFTTYRTLTRGVPAELPPIRSYADFVAESTALRQRPDHLAPSLAYWRSTLRGAAFDLPLPGPVATDRIRSVPGGGQLRGRIEPDLAERLRDTARRDGHTPFSVLLALFTELLHRLSGRTDLVLGSAVGNRPPGYTGTVGMFVNTIALRLRLDRDASALEAVDEATETLIRSLPHQGVPIQDLARELGLHSSAGLDNPLFQVMFSAHDARLPQIDGLGLEVSLQEGFNSGTSRFDLDVVLIPDSRRTVNPRTGPGGMLLLWDYASDLFDASAVSAFHARLVRLLEAYLADSGTALGELAGPDSGPSPDPAAESRRTQ